MGAVMSFNTIVEKVDYIEKNFTELKPVLLNDDALASMLIDMMHDKKFGKSHHLGKVQLLDPYLYDAPRYEKVRGGKRRRTE